MQDIRQTYNKLVLELRFPKERIITTLVCDVSAQDILTGLCSSLKAPCNPYAEVIRGMVGLETENLVPNLSILRADNINLRFLRIDYINRRVMFGLGGTFLDIKRWSFQGILNEIGRS